MRRALPLLVLLLAACASTPLPDRIVVVGKSGSLRVGGERVTFRRLPDALAGSGRTALRADDATPWARVASVLCMLAYLEIDTDVLLPDGPVRAVFDETYWRRDARRLPRGHHTGVILARTADDAPAIATSAARIRSDYGWEPRARLELDAATPFRDVAILLRACRAAGVEVEMAFYITPRRASPQELNWGWDLQTHPLGDLSVRPPWMLSCKCAYVNRLAVRLPVARSGTFDQGERERVLVLLDAAGAIVHRSARIDLHVCSSVLVHEREYQQARIRELGRQWQPLAVAIRADRDTPVRHIGWILYVLLDRGFRDVQFIVASDEPQPGPCLSLFAGVVPYRFPAEQPAARPPGLVSEGGQGPHVFADVDDEDLRARVAQLKALHVVLHMHADTTYGEAVAALDAARLAGADRVEFEGLGRAPEDAMTEIPLPR